MTEKKMLVCLHAGKQDCSDLHAWKGVRNVYILHLITKGKGFFAQGGKTHRLQAGQIFLIYPGQPVHYYPDPEDPYCYQWVDFTGELAKALLEATAFDLSHPVTPVLPKAKPFFDRVLENQNPHAACDPHLLRLMSYLIESFPAPDQIAEDNCAVSARDYILANLHKTNLRIQDVADQIGISRSHLYRVFSHAFSLSPMQFLERERMANACRLLKNSDVSVQYVAASCGYSDPLYFSLAFKKQTGLSPSAYRSGV